MSHPDAVQVLSPSRGLVGGCRDFAEKGDPSAPGACLWCGGFLPITGPATRRVRPDLADRRGAYADNAFCGMRCGYCFGVRLAELGSRLKLKEKS